MKTETILIDKLGNGFGDAMTAADNLAAANHLGKHEMMKLELITEEMLGLVRIVTAADNMSFWIECEDGLYQFHLSTKTKMTLEKRTNLLYTSSSMKNSAASGLLGKLRDKFEQAMLLNSEDTNPAMSEMSHDIYCNNYESAEWDKYERSVLRNTADEIRIGIRGGKIEMIVSKRFA